MVEMIQKRKLSDIAHKVLSNKERLYSCIWNDMIRIWQDGERDQEKDLEKK